MEALPEYERDAESYRGDLICALENQEFRFTAADWFNHKAERGGNGYTSLLRGPFYVDANNPTEAAKGVLDLYNRPAREVQDSPDRFTWSHPSQIEIMEPGEMRLITFLPGEGPVAGTDA